MSIRERLEEIPHRRMDLPERTSETDDPHRPEMRVWASGDDDEGYVVLTIGALWGQNQRFVEMRPQEARKLATFLNQMANSVERATVATSSSELMHQFRNSVDLCDAERAP